MNRAASGAAGDRAIDNDDGGADGAVDNLPPHAVVASAADSAANGPAEGVVGKQQPWCRSCHS